MGVNSNPDAGLNEDNDGSGGAVSSVNSKTGAVTLGADDVGAIPTTAKGVANGVAELGADGKVPAGQLPAATGGVTLADVRTQIKSVIKVSATDLSDATISPPVNNGTYSVLVGSDTYNNTSSNTLVGYGAVDYGSGGSVTIGRSAYNSGLYNVTLGTYISNAGSFNTLVGFQCELPGNYTNASGFGYAATVTGSNQVQLGNSATTTYTYGSVQNRSDARDKADIQDCDLGLDFINALQPKKWLWDYREDYVNDLFPLPDQPTPTELPADATEEDYQVAAQAYQQAFVDWQTESQAIRDQRAAWLASPVKDGSKARQRYHFGVIAQEVKTVLDKLGVDWGGYQDHQVAGGQPVQSIGYDQLIAPLIKAVQQLSARVQQLEQQQN